MSKVQQISVFAQNKPGKIKRVTDILSRNSINIRAITIASGDEYGVIKLLVDDPGKAYQALAEKGLSVALNEVLAIKMEDKPGGLHRIMEILAENNINVEDAYGFVIKSGKIAVLVVNVKDIKKAKEVLLFKRIHLLEEKDLYQL
ncbi:ACT domain-containing protein [Candidatus Aerophobetes bacterium]|uniref:ACT domain-containing protein n=1 Tax=Aerophobetes bacterium TaxID=2030807 RepID=A0A662DDZ9_UNCAE|nr:ACT domain-containing protein [Candidatus Aerophobetes bacterium]RLE12166.1 MAG: hypothetical protein DRI96_04965 [Candidatus Aerophobetes bacterium]